MGSPRAGRRMLGALLLSALLWLGAAAAPAGAAPSRDGWGYAIADDDWEWTNPGHLPSLGDGFAALAPKAFRFQVIWNAVDFPWHLDRARAMIARARAQGVEQIVVTFKKSVGPDVDPVYGSRPSAAGYAEHVGEAVRLLAEDVDVWGPANEPNRGETWLPGVPGAQLLAEYYAALEDAVAAWDPTAEITSPDFVDRTDLGTIGTYVNAYENAGGGWGNHVAFHPYWGAHAETTQTTLDLIGLAPPGASVWITEVGSFARDQGVIEATEVTQNDKVWWLATTLAALPQVERIHYYHMRGNPQASWDTGLMEVDATPRLAWHTWCAMARGLEHPACQPVTPRTAAPPPPPPVEPPPQEPPPVQPPPTGQPVSPSSPSAGPPGSASTPARFVSGADDGPPKIALVSPPVRLSLGAFADGVNVRLRLSEPGALRAELAIGARRRSGRRARWVTVARRSGRASAGVSVVRLVPRRRALLHDALDSRAALLARVRARVTDDDGNAAVASRRLRVVAGRVADS